MLAPGLRSVEKPGVRRRRIKSRCGKNGGWEYHCPVSDEAWPALPYDAWKDTYATLHMWAQIVGKVALAQAPPLNHSWAIAMVVTPRGLSTHTLPHDSRSFTIEFDFVDHLLLILASDGAARTL